MLRIKSFIVNPLGVNCYVVSDESKEAVLIDPGMFATSEWDEAREPKAISSCASSKVLMPPAAFIFTVGGR